MGLDIRWPIGLMFSLIGVMLVVFGLMTNSDAELYKRSLEINVNLRWGLLLLVFGAWMLTMAIRGAKQAALEAAANPKPVK
jgi:protein-S-isoprenylcysteine O-methyltransferase Ste14